MDDGRLMSINVEMIGTGLVVQHYVAEDVCKHYRRINSISDMFTAHGRTKVKVIWKLSAKAIMAFLEKNGMTFEDAAKARQDAGGDHNRRETPLFA